MPDPAAWFVSAPCGTLFEWTGARSPAVSKARFAESMGKDEWKYWERNRYTCKQHRLVPVEDGNA